GFVAIGLPNEDENGRRSAVFNFVSPEFFSVIELHIVRGRTFTASEVADDARVAIVSESTARNLWGEADPLGRSVVWSAAPRDDITLRVVGVVADAQVSSLGRVDPYYVYRP